ncbi:MAG TPA: TetR/AcrR family transcriptional regulator [Syntrophorhabdaceae bacterium]|nr:TetR/AcrR family transcriptional regulator [Syntrophorhabdaceae bacterium]
MNKRSGEDTKRIILDVARKLFSENGYEGSSMRMIAQKADMSVGGLYLHFKNKEELGLTMMKLQFDGLLKELKAAISNSADPVQAIRTYIRICIEYTKKHKELILANTVSRGFAFGIELKKDFFVTQRRFIEAIIREGMESGYFSKCNPREQAKIVMGVLRGFFLSMIVDPDNLFSAEACTGLLMEGLLTRDEP